MLTYNSKLKELSRENRREQTKAEYVLWQNVLRKDKTGYRFLRQRPIGNFIVDFVSLKLNLIIEVDGSSHNDKLEADEDRSIYLEEQGFRIIRYTNEEVLENIESVYEDIFKKISLREREV